MTHYSPFDDDMIMHDSATCGLGIQVLESSEREASEQWLPPSPTFYTSNWRSPIEPSQNKRPDLLQLVTKHWLPNGRYVDLPDGHITLANLTGRSDAEAFQIFDFLLRPRQSSPRTPSLASDDSHSRDSPSVITPNNLTKDPSLSPRLVSEVVQASLEGNEHCKGDLALPVGRMDIGSTNNSDGIPSASIVQSLASPNTFQMDATKCVESPIALEISMPSSGSPPRLQHSLHFLEPTFSQRAMPRLTNVPPTEQDNLKDDDTFLPEPPTNGSGIRSRTKKRSKSSTFECPQCPQRFTRNFDRERHMKTIHVTQTMETIIARTCTCCGAQLSRKDAFKRHIEKIPKSCFAVAKRNQTPEPARLSEETYAIRKIQMMEVCARQS